MLVAGIILVLGAFGLYLYGIRGYRHDGCRKRHLWAIVAGAVLDWIGTMLMPVAPGVSVHQVLGWVALVGMTVIAVGAVWELVRWNCSWGERVVEAGGYLALAIWVVAFAFGLVVGVARTPVP